MQPRACGDGLRKDVTRGRHCHKARAMSAAADAHLNVIFIDCTVKVCAAAPSEYHGVENGQVGGSVEANDRDEGRGLLVNAEHAAGVVDEGGRHFQGESDGCVHTD